MVTDRRISCTEVPLEITFSDCTVLDGKLLVRVKCAEMINDRYYSADVGV
jgi:hypothetical protein